MMFCVMNQAMCAYKESNGIILKWDYTFFSATAINWIPITVIFRPSMIYTIYTVVQWAEHLFKALVYLEKNGKIHCDIKVDNILVSGGFVLKLGDLGLVKSVIETSTVSIRGTPRYMAPEILYNNEQGIKKDTSKRDIWGVGLVLWEIVERRPIGFDGSEELVAVEPNDDSFLPPAPSILNRSAIFTKVNNKSKIDQKEVDPQKILEEKYPELKKLLSLRLKDPKIARLQEFFRQLPTELIVEYAEIAHERIVAKAKEITIFEMKREHRSSFFEDQILEDEGDGGSGGEEMDLKDEVAFLASEAAERCCLKLEIHYFRAIRFIWTFREGSFGNWFVRTELSNLIALFEVWRSIVQKRLHFRSFFSMSTKEEWLLGGKISNNRCLFVRKDLMNAKIWLGSWQDEENSDNCKVRCFNENFELLELEVSPEELDVNNFHKLNIFEFIENQHTNSLLKSVAAMFEELDVEELNDQTEATSRAKRIAYKVGKKLVADHFESNEKPSFNAVREAIMKQAKAVRLPVQVWENFTTGNPSSSERQASKIYHLEVPAHSDEIKFQAFLAEIKNKDIKKSKEKYGTVDDFKKRQNKAFALVIQTLFDWSNRCCLGCLIKGVKVVKIFKEILAFAGPHTYVTLRVFLHNETSCVYLGEAYGHHHFCELDFKTAIILDGFWKSLETFQARDPITRQVKDIEFKGIAKVNLSLINKQLIELMNEVKKRALQIKHPFKISETESFFLLDLQPNQDCISSNPGPSSKSDDQQFKLQYLSYARLYLSLCRVLTQAQSLHDYLDLIKIIVEIIEFKEIVKRVDNRCPKHFFFIKLNKERNVVIVNLHPFEKDDVEHFHVLLLDLDSMSFSRDDFSFTELLRASEETPFHKLHLIEFLSFNLIEKLFTVFSTNYQNRNDLCPFLKNLCIESDDLDLYLSMTLGVCLDFFNEKEQGSGRDPHFNPLEKKSKSPMKLELARQLLYALKAL
ncbi:unnamed protein product, partial [Mesorhabditis belari]|uniref:Protein kinase domain-containing protein n=1 Tax=Mesorhabditis belari TaxID=2138241 RepID=A0AAF3ECA5_9BILA